jgi:hypothetical protein
MQKQGRQRFPSLSSFPETYILTGAVLRRDISAGDLAAQAIASAASRPGQMHR